MNTRQARCVPPSAPVRQGVTGLGRLAGTGAPVAEGAPKAAPVSCWMCWRCAWTPCWLCHGSWAADRTVGRLLIGTAPTSMPSAVPLTCTWTLPICCGALDRYAAPFDQPDLDDAPTRSASLTRGPTACTEERAWTHDWQVRRPRSGVLQCSVPRRDDAHRASDTSPGLTPGLHPEGVGDAVWALGGRLIDGWPGQHPAATRFGSSVAPNARRGQPSTARPARSTQRHEHHEVGADVVLRADVIERSALGCIDGRTQRDPVFPEQRNSCRFS